MKKKIALVFSLVCALTVGVIGTYAWLTAKSTPVQNTFTVGNVNIALDETYEDFKMVPGQTIDKDPKITVAAGSEKSYIFVEIEESSNLETFITYTTTAGWQLVPGETKVFYQVYDPKTAVDEHNNPIAKVYEVINGNKVTVNGESVTKAMLDALTPTTYPTLTFTAYACQYAGFENNVAGAWNAAKTTNYN